MVPHAPRNGEDVWICIARNYIHQFIANALLSVYAREELQVWEREARTEGLRAAFQMSEMAWRR